MTNRIIKILIIVLLLISTGKAWGQCTSSPIYAIIGEGNNASNYPIYVTQSGYSSSVSESIYKYDELQAAGITSGEISSISYQCTLAPGNQRKLTIYLAHVDTFFGSWTYDAGHRHYVTSGLTRV
ncbi:MAG: hypothetical protein II575_00220, partial [Bacteroidales bacterium]|nr:hypothetical protein [Bacteroidales bacterium]